ncbi:hypothetical protein INT47_003521 [Mucor saturninus]|uniref:C2H2-type domain-containing protein n=1 Tax=Mucor saturninus TaxID=64648 RepID=A0A8H7QLV0_9FUNG|nr:hypothetical protein INT47_003521 [Mucor saturninus]
MQNQFKRMKLSIPITCNQCNRKFDTRVNLRNHKRIHAVHIEPSVAVQNEEIIMVDNVETVRVSPSANASQSNFFDPIEQRTFKASCNFSPGDEGHVHDEASIQEHAFTTSQLMSIELYDIVTSFQVSSECHRQIVRLMNTVIRDHEKLAEEYNPHILHAGPVSTLLKEKTSIKAHEYDICKNVCQLFDITKDEEVCSVCKENRYESQVPGSALIPHQTLKMMSVGDQLSKLLSHGETRQKLRYRRDRKENPGIISDYFVGKDYKALKAANLFQSPEDIALVLFVDGFVNQKKSKPEMPIVHYMFQLAIISGKPKDLDSFLLPIVDEIKSLGEHGLIIERWNGETVKAKVHLVMATGDIPQVTKYMHHGGHMATYGCRICLVEGQKRECTGYGMYFQKRGASLRTVDHFVNGDEEHHIKNANLFSALPFFCGSSYYGLDEMHLLGQGIGRFIFDVIVKVNQSNDTSYYSKKKGNFNKDAYTFKVSKKQLELVGDCITKSRANIPVSFQGSWDNLLSKIDGARAIDFLDFLLYVVPTLLVPLFEKTSVRKALLMLSRGCAIALQWELTDSLVQKMESCFESWYVFLDQEILKKNISNSIYQPNNHYLSHISYILIKSKVHAGKNAGNIVERLSIRGYINFAIDTVSLLDTITATKTSLDDFIELPLIAIHNQDHQLWSPFNLISQDMVESVPTDTFLRELKIYYSRSTTSPLSYITINNMNFKIAARALFKTCWYIGAVLFYFEHNNTSDPQNALFLVFVEVMKEHYAAEYDNTIPMIKMNSDGPTTRHAVISLNDVQHQVGLVQSSPNSLEYKVVAPYKIFNENVKQSAGHLKHI